MAKRSRRRKVLILTALIVAAAAVAVLIRVATMGGGYTEDDYLARFNALTREGQAHAAGEPNGWPLVVEAVERHRAASEAVHGPSDGPSGRVDFSAIFRGPERGEAAEDVAALREEALRALELLRREGYFELLDRLAAARRFEPPPTTVGLFDFWFPELGAIRSIARLNGARIHVASQPDGDAADRVRAFESTLALARAAAARPVLIDQLVGIAVGAHAKQRLLEGFRDRPPTEAELLEIAGAMERQGGLPPMTFVCEGERLMALDMVQRTHRGGRFSAASLEEMQSGAAPGGWERAASQAASWLLASRRETEAKLAEFYDGVAALAALPRSERSAGVFDGAAFEQSLSWRFMLLRMIIPATERALASRDQYEMEMAGLRVVLALELYRARNGAYPASLEELAPSHFPEPPRDPFTGREFGYRRTGPGADAEGATGAYVLYSFAADGADDGGRPHPEHPHAALKPGEEGADFVIHDSTGRARE